MSRVDLSLNISLDDTEFIQVGDFIYTTHESLKREQPYIHFIGTKCLAVLKKFEGRITPRIIDEWLLISRALDDISCGENRCDDELIIEELIKGMEHPVSWYAKHCFVA